MKPRKAELQSFCLKHFCLFKDFPNNATPYCCSTGRAIVWTHGHQYITFPGSGTFVRTASYTTYNGKSLIFYLNRSLFLTALKENASCVFSESEATLIPDEGWVCPHILCLLASDGQFMIAAQGCDNQSRIWWVHLLWTHLFHILVHIQTLSLHSQPYILTSNVT